MRIGIFGGSFNPPHLGHRKLADEMILTAELQKMLIIPAGIPPHKSADELVSENHRFEMCKLAFDDEKYIISDIEFKRQGKSYTVDTVAEIKSLYPDDELFLVIGSDMLLSFHKWYRFEEILKNVTLCVATRENEISTKDLMVYAENTLQLDRSDIIISPVEAFPCSSTEIRNKIRSAQTAGDLLCGDVEEYILENGIYTDQYTFWKKHLKARLVEKRYIHSLNVADSAYELALKYGADKDKAYFAGLVHDIMKNASDDEQLQIMQKGGIILTRTETENKKLWHAMAGECYLRCEMGIKDKDILDAVRYHTTGRAGMSLLEKVVYIADYISVERDYSDVDVMRELSWNKGLDEAAMYALKFSFNSLSKKEKLIHTDSVEYYNELIINKKETE